MSGLRARRNAPEPRRTPWFAAATAIAVLAVLFCGSGPEPSGDSNISELEPLTLALRMASVPCVEPTSLRLSWRITGGAPPYTLTVDGQAVSTRFGIAWVNCGLLPTDPQPCDPEPKLHQTFKAVATDSRGVTAEDELHIAVAEPPQRAKPGAVLPGASGGAAVQLGWTAVTEGSAVCAYELRYQAADWEADSWPDSWTAISETIGDGETEYRHSDLDPARRYRYQLRALNNLGAGDWSRAFPEAGVRPNAPALTARTAASGSVALSWVPGASGALRWEYRQRSADGGWGDWAAIVGSDASTADHAVTGLTEDARYRFQLRAVRVGGPGPASATAAAVAGLAPTVPSGRAPIFYDDLDSAGGATARGSYAFLTDAADLASGATTFAGVSGAEALLFNERGYVDRDHAEVLAAVEVGDRITWFAGCWYHYRVTEILADPPAPARKLLRIALEAEDPCGATAAQRSDPTYFNEARDRHVFFGWEDDPPNEPEIGPDGIRIIPHKHAADGGHTYRLYRRGQPTSLVIDVPSGMQLIDLGAPRSYGPALNTYEDEVSGSFLWLSPYTGRHAGYLMKTPDSWTDTPADVAARFEALIASVREVPLP